MKRVRAQTLVLVNWKGVFYERYTLDQNVTALEGDNGAGKTTVMIAAYVVLLPDMTRLRFTNVGESDATGGDKGIWGRLGNPNRPSYAALALDLGREQVIAGVQLERKGEPAVELTPFLISELPAGVRLQDALLLRSGDADLVPELGDLRENVTRLGGRIQVFKTAKDYFAALFERGITPLRLAADEERTRFNDMLRTSMTGGISRALTSEFRSFLLKEESGLADTLVRMRGNLEACRRTRLEVKEAQELEREISGVYEAGHAMFAASLLATRERALELRRRVEEARQNRDRALRERAEVAREQRERIDERSEAERRLAVARAEEETARTLLERVTKAHAIALRIAGFDAELREIGATLARAAADLKDADDSKARRAGERTSAEAAYRRAAEGLADLQRGLEELHRRADAHRTVIRRLAEARATLEAPELEAGEVQALEKGTQLAIDEIDRKRSQLDALINNAAAHRSDHAEAVHALAVIVGREVDARAPYDDARTALRCLADLEMLAARAEDLADELRRTSASQQRQQSARTAAETLARPGESLTSSRAVNDAFRATELEIRELERQALDHESNVSDCHHRRQLLQTREQELEARGVRWRELDTVALRLEATLGAGLRTAQELEAARQLLDEERDDGQHRLESCEKERGEARERARLLEQTGGVFHRDLLAARDLVDGELLASHFDDLDPTRAGNVQARLGPLADAIVVEDARAAAATLDGRDRELDTIWFVQAGSVHELVEPNASGSEDGTDVTVEQNGTVRTTRIPERPTLGRKARQRLIAELRRRAEVVGGSIGELESQLSAINSRRRDTALLTRELATLELGHPGPDLASVRADLQDLTMRIEGLVAAVNDARAQTTPLSQRAGRLRDLLPEAHLLDQPDLEDRVKKLDDSLRSATRGRSELERVAAARQVLSERIEVLRRLPLSEFEIEEMRRELEQLDSRRHRLFLAIDALHYIAANQAALAWTDAEASLLARQHLVPSLQAQCDSADREQRTAAKAVAEAQRTWEEAGSAWRSIDGERSATAAFRELAARELAETGVDDVSNSAVMRAHGTAERLHALVNELDRAERGLGEVIAQLGERLDGRQKALAAAEDHLAKEEKEYRPAEELWERLRSSAEAKGLITPTITQRLLGGGGIGSVNLRQEAIKKKAQLEERLSTARGGRELLERLQSRMSAQDATTGDDDIEVWELTRDWLRRRVPAQVAEVDDPLEALERLRQRLAALGDRLEAQETELRGASEDVARGIDVHIRSAHRQVRLLNHELTGVRFGTIRGMRIRLTYDDRMQSVLKALREGSAQELLFAPTMPVEEALDALFTRYGGRGPTVGHKLLDYREYVDIAVEIQRQASADWERVNPARLSTGEAIGVGTALMMVVLTAWERAANLFRARSSLGTLRLLFLDEANRLSQDNLHVLFELCTALRLQLLIASPEVARAPGCTTYRLVRRETADGSEEVVVSGRRAVLQGAGDVGT